MQLCRLPDMSRRQTVHVDRSDSRWPRQAGEGPRRPSRTALQLVSHFSDKAAEDIPYSARCRANTSARPIFSSCSHAVQPIVPSIMNVRVLCSEYYVPGIVEASLGRREPIARVVAVAMAARTNNKTT